MKETIHDSRLTDSDLDTICAAVDEYATRIRVETRQAGRLPRNLSTVERDTARRLAYHAIGCSAADLRGAELTAIDTIVNATDEVVA